MKEGSIVWFRVPENGERRRSSISGSSGSGGGVGPSGGGSGGPQWRGPWRLGQVVQGAGTPGLAAAAAMRGGGGGAAGAVSVPAVDPGVGPWRVAPLGVALGDPDAALAGKAAAAAPPGEQRRGVAAVDVVQPTDLQLANTAEQVMAAAPTHS